MQTVKIGFLDQHHPVVGTDVSKKFKVWNIEPRTMTRFSSQEQHPLFVGKPLRRQVNHLVMSQWLDFPCLGWHLDQLAVNCHANDPLSVSAQRPTKSVHSAGRRPTRQFCEDS